MKKLLMIMLGLLLLVSCACADAENPDTGRKILLSANGKTVTASMAGNPSADAFLALLQEGSIAIEMHDYGCFEKTGPLEKDLDCSDEYFTAVPGDIILYLGDSIAVYYDENSWEFTLLGHVDGATEESMRDFLGDGDPVVTFFLPDGEDNPEP